MYQNQIQRLKNVVKRALKIVLNSSVISSTLLRREKILDFDLAYKYFCTINMYKILSLNYHESLATKIYSFQTYHLHQTRAVSSQNLTLPLYYLTKCQNSFIYRGIKFWNIIPSDLRNVPNDLNVFKRQLKRCILNQMRWIEICKHETIRMRHSKMQSWGYHCYSPGYYWANLLILTIYRVMCMYYFFWGCTK